MTERGEGWPRDVDVLVVAGLPGWGTTIGNSDVPAVPSTTVDVMKLIRQAGYSVEYAPQLVNPREVSLNAAEVWIPVLVFGGTILSGAASQLLAEWISGLIGRRREGTILHVKYGRENEDGSIEWFEAHGRSDEVLRALGDVRDDED